MIVLALDGPPGDGSFVDSAVDAASGFIAAGANIATVVQPAVADIDPAWSAVVAHGSALTEWAHTTARAGIRTVLTDLPPEPVELEGIHYVDWAWDAGLAQIAQQVITHGAQLGALLIGPDFPPQQRIEHAVLAAAASVGAPAPHVVQAGSFADLTEVPRLAAQVLSMTAPGEHVLTSAGPLGEAVSAELRAQRRVTHGVTRRATGHQYRVASDVQGAVELLLAALVTGESLPRVTRCDIASGLQRIEGAPKWL